MMKRLFLSILPLVAACALSAQTYHNGVWYSIYDDTEHTMNTQGDYAADGVFAPTAGTLNVNWGYEWIDWLGVARKINTQVLTSADGGSNTTQVGKFAENTSNGSNTTESFSVGKNINWIKFNRPNDEGLGGPTHKVHVYHFDIPLAKHILLASGEYGASMASHNFETIDALTVSEPYIVNLRSFLSAGDITVTSSNPTNFRIGSADSTQPLVYAVGANACASANGTAEAAAGGTLGKIANYAFPIYFTPQDGGQMAAVITVSDGVSTATIALTGTANYLPEDTYYAYSADICAGDAYTDELFAELAEEGTYYDTIPNVAGGDSIVTFTLHVHPLFAQEDSLSMYVGDPGEWQGIDLSVLPVGDTTLVAKYNSVYGCDSTYTLYLSLSERPALPVTYGVDTISTCAGEPIEYAGKIYKRPTEDSVLVEEKNIYGGDSIVALVVQVYPTMRMESAMPIEEGEEKEWQGVDLSVLPVGDTTLVAEYNSAYGCDSTYTLRLTVVEKAIQGLEHIQNTRAVEKFFRNGQMYIRRSGRLYTADGRLIE